MLPCVRPLSLFVVANCMAHVQIQQSAHTSPQSPRVASIQARKSEEENIREIVFRYVIGHHNPSHLKVIFLSVQGKDPSSALLARFASIAPPIKPFSRAALKNLIYVERGTTDQGTLYSIGSINWKSNILTTVESSWMNGRKGGVLYRYTVKQKNGKWQVTSEKGLAEY